MRWVCLRLLGNMSEIDPPKGYTLTFEERPGYLYAYVEGQDDTYAISRAYWQEVADKASEIEATRVLIDENILLAGTLAEVFQLASEIPDMGFGRARIAFVDRYLDQNEINEFGGLVATNRGVNGRVFNDKKTAETWLSEP